MQQISVATSNEQKFGIAKHVLMTFSIAAKRIRIDIDEIQGEDAEIIVRDKAQKAFKAFGKPIAVTDDSWSIPALNGFPGPYMKSMNHWFTPEDFIRLMHGKTDRTIYIHQYVAYHDGTHIQVFHNDIAGVVVHKPRGNFGPSVMHIAAMEGDDGLTISEAYDQGSRHDEARRANPNDAWRQLGGWLRERT